jgi:filamentous hemagglutinin
LTTAEQMAILREAAAGGSLGKGNFSLGQATADEANELGAAWVGPGYRISSDGSSWVSSDGLKIYRPPSAKPNSSYATTGVQANFESKLTSGSRPISNGHLNITP